MAEHQTSRLSRLTAILTQLQSKRLITSKEIADRHGVSIRTVYRDIRALEEAGVPVCTEEGKGYTLLENFKVPPIMFTEDEANALITAEQLIVRNKDASLVRNYREAITKIKAVLRYTEKDKIDLLSQRLVFRENFQQITTSNLLSKVQAAITNFTLTRIDYLSEQEEYTTRSIEPFALYSTQSNWILIAWCRLRNDFRSFRLDRITKHRFLTETFTPHNMSLQEYFESCAAKYSQHP